MTVTVLVFVAGSPRRTLKMRSGRSFDSASSRRSSCCSGSPSCF
ncbi:hypothetical protein NKG05_10950 [Oerskovia sp. M15]